MADYSVEFNRTASTTLGVGALDADASTPRRFCVYYAAGGSEATPADNAFLWKLDRITAGPTGTAVTPTKHDNADAAAVTDANENLTANGTAASTFVLVIPANQRLTWQWYAPPGKGFVAPATDGNGFVVLTPTSSAVAVTCTLMFTEL